MKSRVDNYDVTLKPVLTDLTSLSDVVDKKVIQNVVYDHLVKNVNAIVTRGLAKTNTGLKYWVGVQRSQSYLIERRCLFSLGWPPF